MQNSINILGWKGPVFGLVTVGNCILKKPNFCMHTYNDNLCEILNFFVGIWQYCVGISSIVLLEL